MFCRIGDSVFHVSSELRTYDGCCYGYVEAVCCGSVWREIGYAQSSVYFVSDGGRNAFPLISHDNDAIGSQLLGINIVPVKQCAIDRKIRR